MRSNVGSEAGDDIDQMTGDEIFSGVGASDGQCGPVIGLSDDFRLRF